MADPATLMNDSLGAIAARDLDALSATHHDDVIEDFVVLGEFRGRETVRHFFAEMFAAMPDLDFRIERVMGVDDRIAVGEWSLTGTFSGGPFQGIEPTGKKLSLRGVDIMEFEDDLLVRNTIYYDGLAFARQIGLLPAAGTGADRAIMSGFNALTNLKARIRRK